MKKKEILRKFTRIMATMILSGALLLSGCSNAQNKSEASVSVKQEALQTKSDTAEISVQGGTSQQVLASNSTEVTTLDVSDMFSKRDVKTDYEESECVLITLNGNMASCESEEVSVGDGTVIIKAEGYYLLRGTYNGSIRVEAPDDAKVQLILDGITLKKSGTAAIYGKTADKIFITMAEGSKNQITNDGEFQAIDENDIDGAIYSKCDLTLNGNGILTVSSEAGHGIVSKDDLKVTSGTYEITAGKHGISGKDSIRILDGTFTITSVKDGLHSGNDEDAEKGYVYIAGGKITISAEDDGIHGETKLVIADGTIDLQKSKEGLEAAIVEIAGGDVTVRASDDGINASGGSGSMDASKTTSDVYVLISGGRITIDARGDGIDANGSLYVKGGETYVTGPENAMNGALDYDGVGEITGGSLIAIGSSGMAMNFSKSTQGSAVLTADSTHNAGETVQLKDSEGKVILEYVSTRKYASVVVSSPLMEQGKAYTLSMGSETKTFTLDELLYGQSSGFGGRGGFGGMRGGDRGKFGVPNDGDRGDFGDPNGGDRGDFGGPGRGGKDN
ncbi:MAG: carbohydrate-binding domain-containing protein [Acetatifactor sp.]|nr:carbohydrate-binding domain-containing protein [Acetatifactor sp.]